MSPNGSGAFAMVANDMRRAVRRTLSTPLGHVAGTGELDGETPEPGVVRSTLHWLLTYFSTLVVAVCALAVSAAEGTCVVDELLR